MAERKPLPTQETPQLEEMNLRDSSFQFKVFGEQHLQLLPENLWPKNFRNYFDDVRRQNGGELPEDFNPGIPKGCIYVLENEYRPTLDKSSNYRYLSLDNREIILIGFPGTAADEETNISSRPPQLAILESGKSEPNVLEIDNFDFEAYVHEDRIVLVFKTQYRLFYRTLFWSSDHPMLSAPVELFETNQDRNYSQTTIQQMVSRKMNETIHLAWIANVSSLGKHSLYHLAIDLSSPDVAHPRILTDTASSSLLAMNIHHESVWLHWIDRRFSRAILLVETNTSKIFSAKLSLGGELQEVLVSNKPFDNDDWALSPRFVWSYDSFEALVWGIKSPDIWAITDTPLQLALLNTKSHILSFAEEPLSYDEIISEARRQQNAYLRNHPVFGLSREESIKCDQWLEWLDKRSEVIAEGMLMTPSGAITLPETETVLTMHIEGDQPARPGGILRVLVETNPQYRADSIMLVADYIVITDDEAPFEFDVEIPEDRVDSFDLSATAQYADRNFATSYLTISTSQNNNK